MADGFSDSEFLIFGSATYKYISKGVILVISKQCLNVLHVYVLLVMYSMYLGAVDSSMTPGVNYSLEIQTMGITQHNHRYNKQTNKQTKQQQKTTSVS